MLGCDVLSLVFFVEIELPRCCHEVPFPRGTGIDSILQVLVVPRQESSEQIDLVCALFKAVVLARIHHHFCWHAEHLQAIIKLPALADGYTLVRFAV